MPHVAARQPQGFAPAYWPAPKGRKPELDGFLTTANEPPPRLHPEMANFYRSQVAQLYDALKEEVEVKRLQAGEILRLLVKEIILTPDNGALQIDVRGNLGGILAISVKSKDLATSVAKSQVELVAGVEFEPTTFRL